MYTGCYMLGLNIGGGGAVTTMGGKGAAGFLCVTISFLCLIFSKSFLNLVRSFCVSF